MFSRDILSSEFKMCVTIYDYNLREEKMWYSKLVEVLAGDISSYDLQNIDKLLDLGMIDSKWEKADGMGPGRSVWPGRQRNWSRYSMKGPRGPMTLVQNKPFLKMCEAGHLSEGKGRIYQWIFMYRPAPSHIKYAEV